MDTLDFDPFNSSTLMITMNFLFEALSFFRHSGHSRRAFGVRFAAVFYQGPIKQNTEEKRTLRRRRVVLSRSM
jgi:hypothetical protein